MCRDRRRLSAIAVRLRYVLRTYCATAVRMQYVSSRHRGVVRGESMLLKIWCLHINMFSLEGPFSRGKKKLSCGNEILTRSHEILSRSHEIVTHSHEIVTRGNEIVSRSDEIVTHGNAILSCSHKKVTCLHEIVTHDYEITISFSRQKFWLRSMGQIVTKCFAMFCNKT